MHECRHLFEDDCEQLLASLHAMDELLVGAHDVYPRTLSIKFHLFENVGHPPDPKNIH